MGLPENWRHDPRIWHPTTNNKLRCPLLEQQRKAEDLAENNDVPRIVCAHDKKMNRSNTIQCWRKNIPFNNLSIIGFIRNVALLFCGLEADVVFLIFTHAQHCNRSSSGFFERFSRPTLETSLSGECRINENRYAELFLVSPPWMLFYGPVSLFVCLLVCQHDIYKSFVYGSILGH